MITLGFIFGGAGIWAGLSALAGIVGTVSQVQSQRAAAKQAEYDAEYEAQVREQEAEQEKLNRQEAEKSERKMSERRRSQQRSSYAKSGILLEGTPLTFLGEQAEADEVNIQQKNLESEQRRKTLKQYGQSALASGRSRASAHRSAATGSLIGGLAKTGMKSYESYKWWEKNG